jgi:hypothetical protein
MSAGSAASGREDAKQTDAKASPASAALTETKAAAASASDEDAFERITPADFCKRHKLSFDPLRKFCPDETADIIASLKQKDMM